MIKVEKAKNNFTIEMRIFENYEKVKYEIIKVSDFLPIRNISPIELGF